MVYVGLSRAQTRTNRADVLLESCGVLRTENSGDDEKFLGFPNKWVVPEGTAVEIFRVLCERLCPRKAHAWMGEESSTSKTQANFTVYVAG